MADSSDDNDPFVPKELRFGRRPLRSLNRPEGYLDYVEQNFKFEAELYTSKPEAHYTGKGFNQPRKHSEVGILIKEPKEPIGPTPLLQGGRRHYHLKPTHGPVRLATDKRPLPMGLERTDGKGSTTNSTASDRILRNRTVKTATADKYAK